MSRKPISKSKRFEIFKRDSFKCQYCGSSSPDVVLEVDHIKPVAEGGSDDLTNLITSCFDCNRGKGAKEISDKSTLERQRKQLEELNERREQLKMMVEWREQLMELEDEKVTIIEEAWVEALDNQYSVNENGLEDIKKWCRKFDMKLLLDSLDISTSQYLKRDEDGEFTTESVEKAFKYIPRIATNKQKGEEEPYMKDLYYARGILRNRLHYLNERKAIEWLEIAHVDCGYDIQTIKDISTSVKNWTEFKNTMQIILADDGFEI